jgi:hypothetical protein
VKEERELRWWRVKRKRRKEGFGFASLPCSLVIDGGGKRARKERGKEKRGTRKEGKKKNRNHQNHQHHKTRNRLFTTRRRESGFLVVLKSIYIVAS